MKKTLLSAVFTALVGAAINAQSIKVETFTPCKVALLNMADAEGAEYGWWSLWKDMKESGKGLYNTPYTFKKMSAGTYVLVVYNEASATNNDLQSDGVVLEELQVTKKTKLSYNFKEADFKDWNCLSCPWLYIFNGKDFQRHEEVIKDVVGKQSCQTTSHVIPNQSVIDGKLRLRIQEEKDEFSFLDRISLLIDGKIVKPTTPSQLTENQDQSYLELKKGDSFDLEFDLSGMLTPNSKITLECNGYYEPDKAFLQAIFEKYEYKN